MRRVPRIADVEQEDLVMERFYRALSLAFALGTSGLMFALTLA
jgi:hypothetical protein